MDCWLVKFSNGISDSSQEDESVVGCFQFSVSLAAVPPPVRKAYGFPSRHTTLLAAMPPEAKPLLFLRGERKARGFPHGRRQSRMTSESFI